ncbi:MAG: hypothetical protein HN872_09465 [Gammaproteobacteria bacterium]|nr:hypothetical protein [Gammaproteobacteria bacterium]
MTEPESLRYPSLKWFVGKTSYVYTSEVGLPATISGHGRNLNVHGLDTRGRHMHRFRVLRVIAATRVY